MKIIITTSSFGKYDSTPLDILKDKGFEIVLNPFNKKINKEQAFRLYTKDVDGVIAGTETIDNEILKKAENLKVISRCGTGMDNVDLDAAEKHNINVFNTPDGPTAAVAELTIGLILSLLRGIPSADRDIRKGNWQKKMGCLLQGKTVGIIGFGRIGRRAAEMLHSMEAKILYCDPMVNEENKVSFGKRELPELLRESDIVSLHLSYSKENERLIGEKELAQMKKGAFLINVSRGGIVDEKALCDSLKSGSLGGAALDVFEREPYDGAFRELDNVVLTPHVGSYAKEARIKMEIEAARNLLRGLEVKQ